jgi:hypothetical protein
LYEADAAMSSGEEPRYYVEVDGKPDGPFRVSELALAGVGRDTLLCPAASGEWLPAHELPDVATSLDGHWRRLDKAERKGRRLPDPAIFGKLRLAIYCIDGVGGFFFAVGSTVLLVSLMLAFTTTGSAARITMLIGLVPALLGLVLLVIGAAAVGAFLWNGLRVVKVLTPGEDVDAEVNLADWLRWDVRGLGDHAVTGLLLGRNFVQLLPILLFIIPFVLVYCIIAIAFSPVMVMFLILYAPLGMMINRLGYRLDIVIGRYRLRDHKVPWAPINLGFFTALSGLLLLMGPLSIAFFILLPIWVHRTAEVAAAICRVDPARFVVVKPKPAVEAPAALPPSPLDVA